MPIARLAGVTLDCAEPRALSRFYREPTGIQLGYDTDEFVALTNGSGCDLGFQRVDGTHQWPIALSPRLFVKRHFSTFRMNSPDFGQKCGVSVGRFPRPFHFTQHPRHHWPKRPARPSRQPSPARPRLRRNY
ncbi:VOC family protein [Nocardia salmonicida]|uniref:VOC family protein n=1 Tax=Nocardia salmonicida TaxID=53431 RepID=UPI00343F0C1E